MCVAGSGHETLGNALESAPRHFGSLASAHQGMAPCALNLAAHAAQSIQVARHRVVVQVALHHSVEPPAHLCYGSMSSFHQLDPDLCNLYSHALLHRQTQHFVFALSGGAAAVGESQEVKGFRFVLTPSFAIDGRKPTKFDQSRLLRIQGQSKLFSVALAWLQGSFWLSLRS